MSTSRKSATTRARDRDVVFEHLPGHLFRRLHQLAVARFSEVMGDIGLTPIQWSALLTTSQRPGIDQVTLSRSIFIDTSTIAGVLDRLEARGLLQRAPSPDDRRAKMLQMTDEGRAVLKNATSVVLATQEWLMAPLSESERVTFMELMVRILNRHE